MKFKPSKYDEDIREILRQELAGLLPEVSQTRITWPGGRERRGLVPPSSEPGQDLIVQ
jgi:hypothetical protein